MLLQDPLLFDEASDLIKEGKNAEFAFFRATRKIVKAYKKVDDEYLRERINDIKDILRRVYIKTHRRDPLRTVSVRRTCYRRSAEPLSFRHGQHGIGQHHRFRH